MAFDPFTNSSESDTIRERIKFLIFNNPATFFLVLLISGVALIIGVNNFENIGLYRNTTLIIGLTQVVITGYLSFKILSIGKRDSELPNLDFTIVDVAETEVPEDDFTSVVVTFEIRNESFGRAGIRDLRLENKWLRREIDKNEPQTPIGTFFKRGKGTPVQLDKDQSFTVVVAVNGVNYLDELTLFVDESRLGTIEYRPMISDISFLLNSKRRGSEDTSDG